MHGIQHAFVLLRPGDRQHVGIGFFDLLGFRAHAAGDDDLAVLGHGLADGPQQFLLGAIEEAAGVDDHEVSAIMLACKLVALGAQARDDALGIHQRLGASKRHKTDFWGDALFHTTTCRESA